MTCATCALREAGNTERAEAIETIRQQRLLLAMLNGAADMTGVIAAELGGCPDCTFRAATGYLGMAASALAHMAGSPDAAAKWVENGLANDIDNLDGPPEDLDATDGDA